MDANIERFVQNYYIYRRSIVSRDKTPSLLRPLLIVDYLQQYLSIDFKRFLKDCYRYDTIAVFVDRFRKQLILIPYYYIINALELAQLYIIYVYKYYRLATTIVLDQGLQFVLAFQDEFNRILGTKIKLSTAFYPQTDGQTENANQYINQRLQPFVNHYQDNQLDLIYIVDFVVAALPHNSIGLSSFIAEMGYEPCTSFDQERPADLIDVSDTVRKARADAVSRMKGIHNAWEWCCTKIKIAQERQQEQANRY